MVHLERGLSLVDPEVTARLSAYNASVGSGLAARGVPVSVGMADAGPAWGVDIGYELLRPGADGDLVTETQALAAESVAADGLYHKELVVARTGLKHILSTGQDGIIERTDVLQTMQVQAKRVDARPGLQLWHTAESRRVEQLILDDPTGEVVLESNLTRHKPENFPITTLDQLDSILLGMKFVLSDGVDRHLAAKKALR